MAVLGFALRQHSYNFYLQLGFGNVAMGIFFCGFDNAEGQTATA